MFKELLLISILILLCAAFFWLKGAPKIVIRPEHSLIDAQVEIVISNLPPDQKIRIEAACQDIEGNPWVSHAIFQADEKGVINVAKQAPIEGSYRDVDPMGLFWSMTPASQDPSKRTIISKAMLNESEVELSVFLQDKLVLHKTVHRLFSLPDVERKEIKEQGVVGVMFYPKNVKNGPGVIVVPGWGSRVPEQIAQLLASHGFTALALPYYANEGLPEQLKNIPLEYFQNAIRWLKQQPQVNGNKVALLGHSRGGEAVLLSAFTFPDEVSAVVTYGSSCLVLGDFSPEEQAAWTYKNEPIKFMPNLSEEETAKSAQDGLIEFHKGTLDDPLQEASTFLYAMKKFSSDVEAAAIPVEKIQCPLLILSGQDDKMFPATTHGNLMMERLDKYGSKITRKHLTYPNAGHTLFVNIPNTPSVDLPVPFGPVWGLLGGTIEGNAHANKTAWNDVLSFLDENLRGYEYINKGSSMPKFIFPQLSGKYAVGTKLVEMTDSSRNDPETNKPRELVIQLWYPANKKSGVESTSYACEARELFKANFTQQGVSEEKLKLLDNIYTHSISEASANNKNSPYPVVIFAHGNGAPRGGYSFLCEEIASHGYVVIMVMHTYITSMTCFSDGRKITSFRDTDLSPKVEECFADVEFMLNKAMSGAFDSLTSICDFKNISIIGHSLGGMTTAQVCRRDKRVKAGISLDGTLWGIDSTKPFYKPFLYMRTPNFYADMVGILEQQKNSLKAVGVTKDNFIGSVEKFCRNNGKESIQIIVEGANHVTFMDNPIVYDFFVNIFAPSYDIHKLEPIIFLPLPETLSVISGCIITFLNKHLKGQSVAYPPQVIHDADKEDFEFYIPDHHPKHKRINLDSAILDSYVGQYRLGDVVFTVEKSESNVLWVRVANQPAYPIYPESETKFFYTVVDRQMSFVKDKQGKTVQLILHQVGADQVAKKVFFENNN